MSAESQNPDLALLAEVADAVRLQEGEMGVRAILQAFRQLAPAPTRAISRRTGLPLPIVAAVGNELRSRGLLGEERPSRLTPRGHALTTELGVELNLDPDCYRCGGLEIAIPAVLNEAVERMKRIMAAAPGVNVALDQSLCTAETKVRRVLALIRAGVLPGGSVLLVGDDDLVSIAIGVVSDVLDVPLASKVTVVDLSADILEYIADTADTLGIDVDLVQHNLRDPLPEELRGQFDAGMTDPPYTAEGAKLFLSRVVEGLKPGAARNVLFSFGAKGTEEMLDVQREVLGLGLVTHGMIRNFNEYEGSGILGGTGFLQHLLTTAETASSVAGSYEGPLYTREKRSRQREYECVSCSAKIPVGVGAAFDSVAELREAGCPECKGGPFRPLQLVAESESK
ncbi:bis-aminopropyl spermidine synthase family protein [Allokutzneria multivorans]|uniref:Bis-aminopropyl spermidine synthase family protein n=1 Tax=Allokutzneria multivorans TaxID=1142134 RepID=A0ABP7STW9_9PSEU